MTDAEDNRTVIKLAEQFMQVRREFFRLHGSNRENAILSLRAEAYSIATVIVGSGGEARVYFDAALARSIADIEGLKDNAVNSRPVAKKRRKTNRKPRSRAYDGRRRKDH